MIIRMLQAFNGDALLIKFTGASGKPRNIMIDFGTPHTYAFSLKQEFDNLPENEVIDLAIVTHIDNDHIGGIIKFLERYEKTDFLIKEFWANSIALSKFKNSPSRATRLSIKQGNTLEKHLQSRDDSKVIWKKNLLAPEVHYLDGAKFTILSPTNVQLQELREKAAKKLDTNLSQKVPNYKISLKKILNKNLDWSRHQDRRTENGSSLAFIFELEGQRSLFLGDAWTEVIIASLRAMGYTKESPIELDCVKLSHHGSKCNISPELMQLIKCSCFLVSTNGYADKETFACIVKHATWKDKIHFIFNYKNNKTSHIFTKSDLDAFPIHLKFPENDTRYVELEF